MSSDQNQNLKSTHALFGNLNENGDACLPGFTDSAEDELQYLFALSNAVIEKRLLAISSSNVEGSRSPSSGPSANVSGKEVAGHALRLRLLQAMVIEQVPSLRAAGTNSEGAK